MSIETKMYRERDTLTTRKIRAFLVRHGEQQKYEDANAQLSEIGQQQVEQFTSNLLSQFQEEGNKKIVKILYSSRPRTVESAYIIQQTIEEAIQNGIVPNVRIYNSHQREPLQTADPLHQLMNNGFQNSEALRQWTTLSESELEEFGIESPANIAERFLKIVNRLERMSVILDPGPEINYVMVTHETTHTALLNHFDPNFHTKIAYAEPLQIDIGSNGNPSLYSFRDMSFWEG